jgi:uncharacterized membrane protein (DUF485 family)
MEHEIKRPKKESRSFAAISTIVFFVAFFGILLIIGKGVTATVSYIQSVPWYISLPIGAAIIYSIYQFGHARNWW